MSDRVFDYEEAGIPDLVSSFRLRFEIFMNFWPSFESYCLNLSPSL